MTEKMDPQVKEARAACRRAVSNALADFDIDTKEKGYILSLLDDADEAYDDAEAAKKEGTA
jgi:hypothetical protein